MTHCANLPLWADGETEALMHALTPEVVSRWDDVSLAVMMGELRRTIDHAHATGQGTHAEKAVLITSCSNAGVEWARRHGMLGAQLGAVLDNARAWLSDHPGELARHDQEHAAFKERMADWIQGE